MRAARNPRNSLQQRRQVRTEFHFRNISGTVQVLLSHSASLQTNLLKPLCRFSEAIRQHEVRLDITRRQGDRVQELQVLVDLASSYLLEGHCDQVRVPETSQRDHDVATGLQ